MLSEYILTRPPERINYQLIELQLETIGKKISMIRRHNKLTQTQLAFKSGVDYNLLRKIETRGIKCPSFKSILKICRALNIDVNVLFPLETVNNPTYCRDLFNRTDLANEIIKDLNNIQEMLKLKERDKEGMKQ